MADPSEGDAQARTISMLRLLKWMNKSKSPPASCLSEDHEGGHPPTTPERLNPTNTGVGPDAAMVIAYHWDHHGHAGKSPVPPSQAPSQASKSASGKLTAPPITPGATASTSHSPSASTPETRELLHSSIAPQTPNKAASDSDDGAGGDMSGSWIGVNPSQYPPVDEDYEQAAETAHEKAVAAQHPATTVTEVKKRVYWEREGGPSGGLTAPLLDPYDGGLGCSGSFLRDVLRGICPPLIRSFPPLLRRPSTPAGRPCSDDLLEAP